MLKIEYNYEKKASRIELLIRIPYMIILYFVRLLYRSFIIFFLIAQLFFIIVKGERNKTINRIIKLFLLYDMKATAYLFLITDERPRLFEKEKVKTIKKIERKKQKVKKTKSKKN